MKIALVFGAFLIAPTGVFGQGQFLFNTHDPSAGNNIIFYFNGAPATGPDLFVQVFAGPDPAHLQPVTGTLAGPLPLNRTGAGAGYPNPFSDIYTVPGMAAGTMAIVGYSAFQGTSWSTATAQSGISLATSPVTLRADGAHQFKKPGGGGCSRGVLLCRSRDRAFNFWRT
jgi:hypothetical protein